jgi:hypothetical protein
VIGWFRRDIDETGCQEPACRHRRLMAATVGGDRQLTSIMKLDDCWSASNSRGWLACLDPKEPVAAFWSTDRASFG